MKSVEIRKAFIDYFAARGHHVVPSSPLVPGNDKTLLFTNAGMVQFKEIFLSQAKVAYSRAVSVQCCMRAGGKHNDLEQVGRTARHHTFFEMLGNFSFGDYFKREAIYYAWDFLTTILKLPPEKLWVTIYHDDKEAAAIWLNEMKVAPERFSRCGEADNFWSMGDTGPCGPCSEIFYDHGPAVVGGPPGSATAEGDRYIEIWNLVFMEFNRDKAGNLHPLPTRCVDTGMGLERIAAIMQSKHSNYEIDIFQYLINSLQKLSPGMKSNSLQKSNPGMKSDSLQKSNPEMNSDSVSIQVIVDHIRACAFLIMDGVIPGNEGRSYVLRRIIRRAIRQGNKLHIASPFFLEISQPLVHMMGESYPVLKEKQEQIERVLIQEEKQFSQTLEQGLNLLQTEIQNLAGDTIPGALAFKLYDTYGFPLDLTIDITQEQNLFVDLAAFDRLMIQQKALSQSTSQFAATAVEIATSSKCSTFHGYEKSSLEAKIIEIRCEGKLRERLEKGEQGGIILDHTPFYAESGGQVGDSGQLLDNNALFEVTDAQYSGKAIVHYGLLKEGALTINQNVNVHIDQERRQAIRLNHTATHLLHGVLKEILGSHVQQRGSLVNAIQSRFDFAHFEALTTAQIAKIEELVNQRVQRNEPVMTEILSREDAEKSNAVALFGEKYGELVRVLTIGDFSKELCGGTHVSHTGEIGLFKIISESGIASGIRRIEFATGPYALTWVNEQLLTLDNVVSLLKTSFENAVPKLSQFLHAFKQQEKENAALKEKQLAQSSTELLSEVQVINDVNLLIKSVPVSESANLRTLLDQIKSKLRDAVIILFTIKQEKIQVVAGVSKSLLGQVPNAAEFVTHLCGKGGGREDMAQGGGPLPVNLAEKIEEIKK